MACNRCDGFLTRRCTPGSPPQLELTFGGAPLRPQGADSEGAHVAPEASGAAASHSATLAAAAAADVAGRTAAEPAPANVAAAPGL